MSTDVSLRVLQAFGNSSHACVHVLLDRTGLSPEALGRALSDLQAERVLRRVDEVFYRTQVEVDVPVDLGLDKKHLPLLLGMTEDEAHARVSMLMFMKSRLINEWHPIIDKLIADYEKALKIVESLRYGADDE